MNLQRLDEVAFEYHGRYITGKVIRIYPEFFAVRCEDSKGLDYVMHINEPIPLADYERKKEEDRIAVSRAKYQDLIDAFEKFNGDREKMAKALCSSRRNVGRRINACKRRGFIKSV